MRKNLLLFVASLLLSLPVIAQPTKDNVARECVLFEVFTGVRCPYCPAAANAIAQMLEEGLAIAPIGYQTSAFSIPEYYTNETNARANYYGINSYPTLKADGIRTYSNGGSASETLYPQYLSIYNSRKDLPSPFTIDLSFLPLEGNLCQVKCTVNQVGECTGNDVRVFIVLTQSNIDVNWQGMHSLHCVARDMIPTQNGTVFTGPAMTVTESFELNYPKEDCHLVAWVQNYGPGNKEVYQAVRLPMTMNLDYDLAIKKVDNILTSNCSGVANPTVNVKNLGNQTVTSFEVVAYADNNEVKRVPWDGSLAKDQSVDVVMDEFSFGSCTNLKFEVVKPNGHDDGFMADNVKSIAITTAPHVTDGYLLLKVRTGSNVAGLSFDLKDMNTGNVIKTVRFEQTSHTYDEPLILETESCYHLTMRDTTGNGMSGGFFVINNSSGKTIFKGGGNNSFTYEMNLEVTSSAYDGVAETSVADGVIFPNPSSGRFDFMLPEGDWHVSVRDLSGREVFDNPHFASGEIDLSNCKKGIYLIQAENGVMNCNKKVVVL